MASLETYNSRSLIRQQVNNLALAFVAPLSPQNDYVLAHDKLSVKNVRSGGVFSSTVASGSARRR
jgi:hypothetical protein